MRGLVKTKLWVKVAVLAAIGAVFLLSGLLLFKGFNITTASEPGESYSYTISRNTDYKVYLVNNSHYDVPYLSPKDNPDIEQYASSLIDYIDVDFMYNYSQSMLKNFYTSYSVKAVITGQYENTKNSSSGELWKKNYILLNDTDLTNENTSTYHINENVKINYNNYNSEVDKYRATTHLAIDAELAVIMQIKTYDVPFDSPNFKREKPVSTDEITLNIPLTASATKVEKKYENRTSETVTPSVESKVNITMVISGAVGLLISGVLFLILFRSFFRDERTEYEKKLDKIMRNNSDVIAEVESGKVGSSTFVDIKSFDDLVDIEEELKTPILHYEIKEGKESWFIIKSDPVYRYILKGKTEKKIFRKK